MPKSQARPVQCACDTVYRMAQEPDVPLAFDQSTNEYHLVFGVERSGRAVIYFCFSCGGALPNSRRAQLFAVLTSAETRRLRVLTRDLRSIDDAIRKLGPPDHDLKDGESVLSPGSETEPDYVQTYRTLIYSQLSETADVRIVERFPHGVGVEFVGKYIGENK
jgi:hypothetical protein